MTIARTTRAGILASALAILGAALVAAMPASAALAPVMPNMSGMPPHPGADAPVPPAPAPAPDHDMPGMDHKAKPGGMAGMAGLDHAMPAMLGPYAMTREASGTAWQPDSAPMTGTMLMRGGWSGMAQGYATLVNDHQGGARGDTKTFSASMAMLMAARDLGGDRLGLRAMLSLDPLMGKRGYPLLFATGETADGVHPLIDRQHPHDLFMELAASLSHDLGGGRAVFVYAGLPGEPALGPPTFMHRVSGLDNPEAPIGHHWFDSTHITFGVVTAGFSTRAWKVEASAFKGREPDQHRWNFDTPELDSWSIRAFWNPTANLSLQASTGHLRSPEQLEPDRNEQRTTLSATYNRPLGARGNGAATLAWSAKNGEPGPTLHALLAETALRVADRHTLYARAEHVQEDELFGDDSPLDGAVLGVTKLSLGYQYALPLGADWTLALGALASGYAYPRRIEAAYGREGVKSFMLYTRILFGR